MFHVLTYCYVIVSNCSVLQTLLFRNSLIRVNHLPCHMQGSGTHTDTKGEPSGSEQTLLPHVGHFIFIVSMADCNLFETRLQGEKTKQYAHVTCVPLTHLTRTQTHGPIVTIAGS
jgi:hypothetical protein